MACGTSSAILSYMGQHNKKGPAAEDGRLSAWVLPILRFHYDFQFNEDYTKARLKMYVFGFDLITNYFDAVWHVELVSDDGSHLRRTSSKRENYMAWQKWVADKT